MNKNREIDLYKVLNIEQDATLKDVRKSFRKLSKKYHPDKLKTPNMNYLIPIYQKKYELITTAYNILSDKDCRREYDQMSYINKKQHDFIGLKEKFDDDQNSREKPLTKEEAFHMYDEISNNLDKKHKIKDFEERTISKILSERENLPQIDQLDNVDDDESFNNEFYKNVQKDTKIIKHTNPVAASIINTEYQDINNIDELYSNKESTKYSNLNDKSVYSICIEDLDSSQINEKSIVNRMENYENETSRFKNMNVQDFNKNNALPQNTGYNFSNEILN